MRLYALALLVASAFGAATSCDSSEPAGQVGDDVASACVRATACDIKVYPRVRDCIDYFKTTLTQLGLAPIYSSIYRCVNTAKDCFGVEACFGRGPPCDSTFKGRCEQGVAIQCDLLDKRIYRLDCKAVGQRCQPDASFGASCVDKGQGALIEGLSCDGVNCNVQSDTCISDALDRCSGDQLESCLEGRWVRFYCGALGLGRCAKQAAGFGRCTR